MVLRRGISPLQQVVQAGEIMLEKILYPVVTALGTWICHEGKVLVFGYITNQILAFSVIHICGIRIVLDCLSLWVCWVSAYFCVMKLKLDTDEDKSVGGVEAAAFIRRARLSDETNRGVSITKHERLKKEVESSMIIVWKSSRFYSFLHFKILLPIKLPLFLVLAVVSSLGFFYSETWSPSSSFAQGGR